MKVTREFLVSVVQLWEVPDIEDAPLVTNPEGFDEWVLANGVRLEEHQHYIDNDELTVRIVS